jgi:hypothetical protein
VNVVVVVAQHQPVSIALLDGQQRHRPPVADVPLEWRGSGERGDLFSAIGGEEAMSQLFDPGFAGRVVEPRHEVDSQSYLAAGTRHLTVQLRVPAGRLPVEPDRHEIHDSNLAVLGAEGGFENIGGRQVALSRGVSFVGLDHPAAAVVGIENRREDARAIEPWEAAPVHPTMQPNQRGGAQVSDQSVTGNGWLVGHVCQ